MKIAILSNGNVNYSTLRLKEEAEKRDHIVKIIKYRKCYVTIDEKNPTVMYGGEALDQYDAIIPRIASNMTRYGTAVARQLEMAYPRTLFVNRSIAITRARDKLRSTQLLARGGVAIPKTVFSRNSLVVLMAMVWCWLRRRRRQSRCSRRCTSPMRMGRIFSCKNLFVSRLEWISAPLWWGAGLWRV